MLLLTIFDIICCFSCYSQMKNNEWYFIGFDKIHRIDIDFANNKAHIQSYSLNDTLCINPKYDTTIFIEKERIDSLLSNISKGVFKINLFNSENKDCGILVMNKDIYLNLYKMKSIKNFNEDDKVKFNLKISECNTSSLSNIYFSNIYLQSILYEIGYNPLVSTDEFRVVYK